MVYCLFSVNLQLRTLRGGHEARVGSLAWNNNILTIGAKDGLIIGQALLISIEDTTTSGACLNSVDAGSQVCGLLRNKNEKELLSSHGTSQNQLTLWKYPSTKKLTELNGHTSRVLYMTQSPDGCLVASAAGDETLRLWNVFGIPQVAKSKPKTVAVTEPFARFHQIR
ncbi:hypothetical protein QQ045_011951 [Rhodiola kirilowii]